jgi:SagB-type dehydrogenase family enzyme
MESTPKNSFQGLIDILRKNIAVSRRQVFQVGALFGLSLSSLMPFQPRKAFAMGKKSHERGGEIMDLPEPVFDGGMSLEQAVRQRRTVRSFRDNPITKEQFSQLLWAAQGITEERGFKRAAPSGGALYPADVYAVIGENGVKGFGAGVYLYEPKNHLVRKIADGDKRRDVAMASLRQMWMAGAPVQLVVTAEYGRITIKYGDRGIRYALIEIGHIGQNIFLQCQTLGLAAGIVGAFSDGEVARVIRAEKNHQPLIIFPVGWQP